MLETFKTSSGRISVKTGVYGPKHDPYGYEEITVEREGHRKATLHIGLGTWFEGAWSDVEDIRLAHGDEGYHVARFESECGWTLNEIRRAIAEAEYRRQEAMFAALGCYEDPMGRLSDYE